MEGMMSGILKNQMESRLKDGTKNVKFKSLYTWSRISGFLCTLIILGMCFQQFQYAPGCSALAVVGACFCLFCEAVCCFKCCSGTKACAGKIDAVISYGPFFKGTLYMVIGVVGFIAYHFEVTVPAVDQGIDPPVYVGVIFFFILFLIPGILYILAFIITDQCKLKKPKGKTKKGKDSDIEEQFNKKGDKKSPSGQPNNTGLEKMKNGFNDFGARMSNGFKQLGEKMKVGQSSNSSQNGPGSGTAAAAAGSRIDNSGASDNPFAKKKRESVRITATVTKHEEVNPFL